MSYAPTPYEQALRVWLLAAAGGSVPVIYAHQEGPRPAAPFVLLQILRVVRQGSPAWVVSATPQGAGYAGAVRTEWRGVAQVSVFGRLHRDLAAQVIESDQLPATLELLEEQRLSLGVISGPLDAPEALSVQWGGRSVLEVEFAFASERTQEAEVIETVTPAVQLEYGA